MRIIQQKIKEYVAKGGTIVEIADNTSVDRFLLRKIMQKGSSGTYQIRKLRELYEFFGCEIDEIYIKNIHKLHRPTESVLGNLFRNKRIARGRTIDDVAYKINHSPLSIKRLEAGETLPSYSSYIITQIVKLYEFTEGEEQQIKRFVAILRDMITLTNKYDIEKQQSKK